MISLVTIVGTTAAFFTTFAYAPQTFKTLKTQNTKGISTAMYLMCMVGVLMWVGYGLFKQDWILVVSNAIIFLLALPVFCLALKNACSKKITPIEN
jgi:MtN3 and saliva related transmembrane protein